MTASERIANDNARDRWPRSVAFGAIALVSAALWVAIFFVLGMLL